MWSRTFANPETSDMGLPSEPRKGVSDTAADKIRFGAMLRSVCKNESKLALSFGDTTL